MDLTNYNQLVWKAKWRIFPISDVLWKWPIISTFHQFPGKAYNQTKAPLFFRKGPDRSEQFTMVTSTLTEFGDGKETLSVEGFLHCAKEYQLAGKPIAELCEHNAAVAMAIDNYDVGTVG